MFQSQNIQKTTSPVYAGVKKNIAVAKNLERRFSLSPACPRFQKAQRFIFSCKIGQVTGQNLIFFLTFWALNRLFRGWKQVSLCLVRNFVSNTFGGHGIQGIPSQWYHQRSKDCWIEGGGYLRSVSSVLCVQNVIWIEIT